MKCEQCGLDLNKGKRFCSKECYRLFRVGKIVVTGKKFKKGSIPWNKGLDTQVDKICLECGKKFRVPNSRKDTAFWCSKKCAGKQQTHIAEYQKNKWKNKLENGYEPITPESKLERKRFRESVQKEVLERDNYTCQMCNERGGYLQVDHIQKWADYVELRFDINNCRTLCMDCHYLITFGRKKPESVIWGHNLKHAEMRG